MKELSQSTKAYLSKIDLIQSASFAAYLNGFDHINIRITQSFSELTIFTHSQEETENAVRLLQNYIGENYEVQVKNLTTDEYEFYTAEISIYK